MNQKNLSRKRAKKTNRRRNRKSSKSTVTHGSFRYAGHESRDSDIPDLLEELAMKAGIGPAQL
jgi:hypothetical protein